jgi:PncC family amidohydrolase
MNAITMPIPFMTDRSVVELQELFISRGMTLSVAESCTGGHLAARLTRQSGCSQYFMGGVVAYSNACKTTLLGVDSELIVQKGAVSSEVVQQMARGVRSALATDYSLAVSGIAGPEGGTSLKPVGTIWAAIGKKDEEVEAWTFQLTGFREEIINASVERLIERLLQRLRLF